MSQMYTDADGLVHFRDNTRETIIKSGLSGVAATVLAVTMWSPAGFGGMIGTSVAADHTPDSAATADAIANLAAYPAPLTTVELQDIRARLTDSELILEESRAETDASIHQIRSIASHANIARAETLDIRGPLGPEIAAPVVRAEAAPAPVAQETAEAPAMFRMASAEPAPGGGSDYEVRDPHMELAELLLAHR